MRKLLAFVLLLTLAAISLAGENGALPYEVQKFNFGYKPYVNPTTGIEYRFAWEWKLKPSILNYNWMIRSWVKFRSVYDDIRQSNSAPFVPGINGVEKECQNMVFGANPSDYDSVWKFGFNDELPAPNGTDTAAWVLKMNHDVHNGQFGGGYGQPYKTTITQADRDKYPNGKYEITFRAIAYQLNDEANFKTVINTSTNPTIIWRHNDRWSPFPPVPPVVDDDDKLPPGSVLAYVFRGGKPISGPTIQLKGPKVASSGVNNGYAYFEGIPAGNYTVSVSGKDNADQKQLGASKTMPCSDTANQKIYFYFSDAGVLESIDYVSQPTGPQPTTTGGGTGGSGHDSSTDNVNQNNWWTALFKAAFVPTPEKINAMKLSTNQFVNWGPMSLVVRFQQLADPNSGAGHSLPTIGIPQVGFDANGALVPLRDQNGVDVVAPITVPSGTSTTAPMRLILAAGVYITFGATVIRLFMPRQQL